MHIVALLLFNHLITLIAASPPTLSPRKSTTEDPYMICNDPVPFSSLPDNYPRFWYPRTLDLCSALNGNVRNVGCICHSSTSSLDCNQNIADPVLWNTRIYDLMSPTTETYLPQFCDDECFCAPSRNARAARYRYHNRASTTTRSSTTSRPTNTVPGVIRVPLRGTPIPQGRTRPNPIPIQVDATGGAQGGGGGSRNWWQNQCGSNCTSNADCAGGGSGCTCLAAHKSTFEPAVGTVAFVAACIVSLAASGNGVGGQVGVTAGMGGGGGGKRSVGGDAVACPCNTTYVSTGCCEVDDGLVWEGREAKLGELAR